MLRKWVDTIADTLNYLKLAAACRLRNAMWALTATGYQPRQQKPRLLMLADVHGWAFDDWAQQRAEYIASGWDVNIQYLCEKPQVNPEHYDLMFDPSWDFNEYDSLFFGHYVRGINSHKWECQPRPYTQLRKSLNGAVACFVCSRALLGRIQPVFYPTFQVKSGIDPKVFYWIKDRLGPDLVAGWAGNPRSIWKRLETVIKPACSLANVELRIASNLSKQDLNLFYNDVDIVLVGSEPLEGDPVPLYEAGSCGRTVIATNVGTVPEIVENCVNGFVVESTKDVRRTVSLFVERLNWCKEHIDEVRQMGKRHRERVLRERTPERTCEEFRQAIEWAYARVIKER